MKKLAFLAMVIVLAVSASARADLPNPHDLILTGDFAVSYQHVSSSAGSGSITIIRLAPSFDWVATPGLTLGAWLVFDHTNSGGESADDYGIIPRLGFMAALSPRAFLWPRAGIGFLHGVPDLLNLAVSGDDSVNRVQLDLDLPILYTPFSGFFIGGGLLFRMDLTASRSSDGIDREVGKLTVFGLTTVIGGYF